MDLLEAAVTMLLAQSSVTDVVGPRVHKVKRPQGGALPALVVSSAGGAGEDLDLQDEADSAETRLQFSGFGETNSDARAAVDAATALFIGAGNVGSFLFWEGEREAPIDLGDDTPQGFVHHVARDVLIRHSR